MVQNREELTLENIPPTYKVVETLEDGWVVTEDQHGSKWLMRFSRSLYGVENLIIHPYDDVHPE